MKISGILNFFKSKREKEMTELKNRLREKYLYFKEILANNNQTLSVMSDIEEKLSESYLFDRAYVNKSIEKILTGTLKTVEFLNKLSENKYMNLKQRYELIRNKIEEVLAFKIEIPTDRYILFFEELNEFCKEERIHIGGGKVAHLAELKSIGIPVPEGFVVTSFAFLKFLEYNNLKERIQEKLKTLQVEDLEALSRASLEIREMVLNSSLPKELEESMLNSCQKLYERLGKKCNFAVRSSAIFEDTFLSFAGQYASFLNVPEKDVPLKYKEVIASLFSRRAIFYYKTRGLPESEMLMAVGILSMIEARAGGVIYSIDPENPESDNIIISAVKGLGKLVVDGVVVPDSFIIKRGNLSLVEKIIGKQDKMLICELKGDLKEIEITHRNLFSITEDEAIKLAEIAIKIENYYQEPQDIEWAIDKDGKIFVLQSRPLKTAEKEEITLTLPTRIKNYNILIEKGIPCHKGIGYGKAFILKDDSQLKDFPEGWVLVAPYSDPRYVLIMNKASAIITDVGSPTSHMGCLAKEFKIPSIVNTEIATKVIPHGIEITVDAINCVVYEGKVEELIKKVEKFEKKRKKTENIFVYKLLKEVLKYVTPLNLVNPSSPDFVPENCQTLHDILRFAHEMAMHEMFNLWSKYEGEPLAIPLQISIPIGILVLDLDGGLKEGEYKVATFDDITSIPFKAILRGMLSVKWPETRPVDIGGFFSMVAHTASVPEDELIEMGKKSFCIITKDYMNFSIRLGYHFSLVESYIGEVPDDNYIRFFFKGGGAAIDRRLRRVWLISEILKLLNFNVKTKHDLIDALLIGYNSEQIEKRLERLGKLTGYTKQLDMVLFNDTIAEIYLNDFINLYLKDLIH